MISHKQTVAILGAGSWGTAIAIHIAKQNIKVLLWGHTLQHVENMKRDKGNQKYLPDISFPLSLEPTNDFSALSHADFLLVAVPSHGFLSVIKKINFPVKNIAWLTKGIDPGSHQLFSELLKKKFGAKLPIAIISGPSFAKEVAQDLPTALTITSENINYQKQLQKLLHHDCIRTYLSSDMVGVQLFGTVKNVLAIACGVSDGLGYGANARAALITRGLAEMSRLGAAFGAKIETVMGLTGVGDLVLTCTDDQSRNRRFGLQLGQGIASIQAEKVIGQVIEGKHNAQQICDLAQERGIEMPICEQVNALLQNKCTPAEAAKELMNRPAKNE